MSDFFGIIRGDVASPSGFYATYQYDGLDRLTLIQDQGTTTLNSFTYDGPGRIASRSDGTSGAAGSANVTYDGVSRVATLTHDLASTGADVTWTYTRNSASQLGSVVRSNDSYAWAGLYTVTRNYTPNGLNQYGTIATVGGSTLTLIHDANGNLTSDGAGGNTYTYDIENRMVSVSGAHAATLVYDPLGRLWQVTSGANLTQFVYDGDALIAEYNGSGTLLRRFVHGTDAAADDPMVWYEGSAVQYLHVDHQGSIVAVANSGGTSVATDTYDEYGIPGAANAGRFQYTAQAWLAELGLYYYKARMYSPTLGRFMQIDPIGYADQFNLYEYVRNDPVNQIDPTGRDAIMTVDPNGVRTLVIPVHITVVGGTPESRAATAAAIVARANNLRTDDPTMRIQVVLTSHPIEGVLNELHYGPGKDIAMCGAVGECTNRMGGDRIHISSDGGNSIGAAAHDIFHLAGIDEGYVEGPLTASGQRTMSLKAGHSWDEIMASRFGTRLRESQFEEAARNSSTRIRCEDEGNRIIVCPQN